MSLRQLNTEAIKTNISNIVSNITTDTSTIMSTQNNSTSNNGLIANITNLIHKALRYSLPERNMTSEELTLAMGDPMPAQFASYDAISETIIAIVEYSQRLFLVLFVLTFLSMVIHAAFM